METQAYFGKNYTKFTVGKIAHLATKDPLTLASGTKISNFPVAYQTYGKLNNEKSNAILIFHALTGDQYVASKNPITGKPGWWDFLVGPDKTIDTEKFFIICANVLGGCVGSFGPKSENLETKEPYNTLFPVITISDMVKVQKELVESFFGIEKLFAIIGGSMGGMLALEWASKYPNLVECVIPIATAARHTAQNIAFHEVGRKAIMMDQNWCGGSYLNQKKFPYKGLAVARMTAHVTYLSETSLAEKFGRNLQDKKNFSYAFDPDFQVESYLNHQGLTFVDRFDANSYLYITRAMDYFDLEEENNGNLSSAFVDATNNKFCVISFSDDWLFPTSESRKIAQALNSLGINVSSVEINSNRGHDSFLIPNEEFSKTLKGFLEVNYSAT